MYGVLYLVSALLIISCNSTYTSKKEGYFKINFTEKAYTTFDDPAYTYTFEYPVYAKISKDSSFFKYVAKNTY